MLESVLLARERAVGWRKGEVVAAAGEGAACWNGLVETRGRHGLHGARQVGKNDRPRHGVDWDLRDYVAASRDSGTEYKNFQKLSLISRYVAVDTVVLRPTT